MICHSIGGNEVTAKNAKITKQGEEKPKRSDLAQMSYYPPIDSSSDFCVLCPAGFPFGHVLCGYSSLRSLTPPPSAIARACTARDSRTKLLPCPCCPSPSSRRTAGSRATHRWWRLADDSHK